MKIFRKKYREPLKYILMEFSSDTLAASETMESKIEKCMDIGTVLFSLLFGPGPFRLTCTQLRSGEPWLAIGKT